MSKSHVLPAALVALFGASSLLMGAAVARADVIDTYSVSDPDLVDPALLEAASVAGTLVIDLTTGRVAGANLNVTEGSNSPISIGTFGQSADTAGTGIDLLVQSNANDLQLDILTGVFGSLFPSTFAGGSVIAGNDTFFLDSAGNIFTPFGAGRITFEASNQPINQSSNPPPPPSVPEPTALALFAGGLGALALLGRRRRWKAPALA